MQATRGQYLISIVIFSMAPVVGTGIGTYLSENTSDDKEAIENDLPLQVLQGNQYLVRCGIFHEASETIQFLKIF